MLKFKDECVTQNNVSNGKEMTENITERSETEFASVKGPLKMQRTASNEANLVSEIPNIVNNENFIIASGQEKTISILSDEFFEEQAFPYLLPKGKLGYNAPQDIPISPEFNEWLLNFNQHFASDADYIFFSKPVYEQYHLRSSINFAMHKIKPGTLAVGMVKNNFKGVIGRFVASDNAFLFMSSVKGTPAYWKKFLYDVLAMFKQLGIPTYFLTLLDMC